MSKIKLKALVKDAHNAQVISLSVLNGYEKTKLGENLSHLWWKPKPLFGRSAKSKRATKASYTDDGVGDDMIQDFKSDRGQELVEFALLLPLLMLFLLGIVEFGIAGFAYNTITNAAREVARYGIIHPNQAEIDAYIQENLSRWTSGIHGDDIEVVSTVEQGVIQGTVHVTVTYEYQMITGPVIRALGGQSDLELQTTSTMYTETFPD